MRWEVGKCPCEQKGCNSATIIPVLTWQGIMDKALAKQIVREHNAHEALVAVAKRAASWMQFSEDALAALKLAEEGS